MLRRRYGPSFVERMWKLATGQSGAKPLEKYTHEDRFMQGHHCFGIHRVLPVPSTYFTMLREPVSRLISLYHFSRENPTAYYHEYAKQMSIDEFLIECELHELDNGQVRFIAGDEEDRFINRTPFGECDESLLEQALKNIDRHFFHVGVVEAFDISALMLKEKLGWRTALYLRRNTRNRSRSRPEPSEHALEVASDRNAFDQKLYSVVKERALKEFEEAFHDSEHKLERFQRRNAQFNAVFGPLYDRYAALKVWAAGNASAPT